jgi:hypothetical protein
MDVFSRDFDATGFMAFKQLGVLELEVLGLVGEVSTSLFSFGGVPEVGPTGAG